MKNKIKRLESLLLKIKMETYINRKTCKIHDEEIETLEKTIVDLKERAVEVNLGV